MPSLGPAEILVVRVVALLVFGPNKMPEIARQVGRGFREFRRVQQHLKSELRDVVSEFDQPSSTPAVHGDPVPMLPPKEEVPAAPEAAAPAPDASASTAPAAPPSPSTPPNQPSPPAANPEPDASSEPA
jgi:TatA/E family protein of Tat protein translocase